MEAGLQPAGVGGVEGVARPRVERVRRAKAPKLPGWVHPLVIVVALLPFAWVAWAMWSDVFQGTRHLGSEPIKESEHFTGKWALRFLLTCLAVTPVIRIARAGWLITYRRTFGLVAFFYACVHLTIYFGLDIELMWSNLVEDVLDRTYITLGMTALLLMVPLALTSTKASIRWLGNRKWTAVHRLVYVSAVLGVTHFFMAVKKDVREPLVYGAILATLFAVRWWYRRPGAGNKRAGDQASGG